MEHKQESISLYVIQYGSQIQIHLTTAEKKRKYELQYCVILFFAYAMLK